MYTKIIGMINRAPTSMKPRLCSGAAACHRLMAGGMSNGQILIPKPLRPRNTSSSVSKNGE
ncbi:hypothetical protein D3C80_2235230 [compost metagenome]